MLVSRQYKRRILNCRFSFFGAGNGTWVKRYKIGKNKNNKWKPVSIGMFLNQPLKYLNSITLSLMMIILCTYYVKRGRKRGKKREREKEESSRDNCMVFILQQNNKVPFNSQILILTRQEKNTNQGMNVLDKIFKN